MGRRLTEAAHAAVAGVLGSGERAVDATVGNGLDTVFLAQRVAPGGHVYGFDVQAAALASARRRLEAAGLANHVTLVADGHENLAAHVPDAGRRDIGAAMFNLGYLPGGDRSITTTPRASCAALRTVAGMLRPGGIVTVMAYRGHAGGKDEAMAIAGVCETLSREGFSVSSEAAPKDGPVLWILRAPAR